MSSIRVVLIGCAVICSLYGGDLNVSKILRDLSDKCESAKAYTFEGELSLDGQRGQNPGRVLTRAKIQLAVADGGKYLLRVRAEDKDEYQLISDGQKSWAWVPKLKKYTEQESAILASDGEDDEEAGGAREERDLADTFSHLIIPTLARLYSTAASADLTGYETVKIDGKSLALPAIRVLSKKNDEEGQSMTEMIVDPDSLRLARLMWANVKYSKGEKTLVRLIVNFDDFRIGESLPDSSFVFEPPKKAKLVDAVPIPGQSGSFLLNQPAPDFELKTLDGEKVRLSDLRGHPVLLTFWASWCGPCRRELPGVAKLDVDYKDRGLVVLGVNDEGKGTARKFLDKSDLPISTLDDSGQKAHRLYRVRSIPATFLIDRDGKIVRFFSGTKDEETLRAALKGVGL